MWIASPASRCRTRRSPARVRSGSSTSAAVVYRLGAPLEGAIPLAARWAASFVVPPLDGFVTTTPAAWRDRIVVLSGAETLVLMDASTGRGARLARVADDPRATIAPVVAGDVAVVVMPSPDSQELVAYDLPDGAERWRSSFAGNTLYPPSVVGDTLVVGGVDTAGRITVTAVGAADGEVRWEAAAGTVPAGDVAGAQVVAGTTVVGGTPLMGWDLESGEPLWASAVATEVVPAVAPDGGTVYAATVDGQVAAVDTASGEVRWSVPAPAFVGPLDGNVVASDDAVVVAGSSTLSALRPTDGTLAWSRPLARSLVGGASFVDGRIWLALADTRVFAVDPSDGAVVASFAGLRVGTWRSIQQVPAAAGDSIVVATGEWLYAVPRP